MLIRLEIKAISNCEEGNLCLLQNVHGRVQRGNHGIKVRFTRECEVGRVGTLSSEAFEYLAIKGILVLKRTIKVLAWIYVPEDDGLVVLGLNVRRCGIVDRSERGATVMRSVNYP